MKFNVVAAALTFGSSLANPVHAGPVSARADFADDPDVVVKCFDSGKNLEYDFYNAVSDSCYWRREAQVWGKPGEFAGVFQPKERKQACINLWDGSSLKMAVTNMNTENSYDLLDQDCLAEFHALVNRCRNSAESEPLSTQGGTRTKAGWLFELDPDDKKCTNPTSEDFDVPEPEATPIWE